jgi:hypothetical protein
MWKLIAKPGGMSLDFVIDSPFVGGGTLCWSLQSANIRT